MDLSLTVEPPTPVIQGTISVVMVREFVWVMEAGQVTAHCVLSMVRHLTCFISCFSNATIVASVDQDQTETVNQD